MKNINILVFRNDKRKNDKQPEYNLTARIGEEWLNVGAGWSKTSAKNTKFISLSLDIQEIKKLVNDALSGSDGKEMPFANKDEELL